MLSITFISQRAGTLSLCGGREREPARIPLNFECRRLMSRSESCQKLANQRAPEVNIVKTVSHALCISNCPRKKLQKNCKGSLRQKILTTTADVLPRTGNYHGDMKSPSLYFGRILWITEIELPFLPAEKPLHRVAPRPLIM